MGYSFIVYAAAYTISIFFIVVYQKLAKNKTAKYSALILSMAIPIILAGVRYDVGTDYFQYQKIYYSISTIKASDYIQLYFDSKIRYEIGYYLINRCAKVLFNSVYSVAFISEGITIFFIYKGLLYYKEKINLGIGLFIYYMLFYQDTFNIVRQCISMAIIFYAYRYILEKKLVKYLFFVILGMLFHISSLAFVALYLMNFIDILEIKGIAEGNNNRSKQVKNFVINIIMIFAISFFILYSTQIVNMIMNLSFFQDYSIYQGKTGKTVSFIRVLYSLVPIIIIFINKKYIQSYQVFVYTLLLQVPLYFTVTISKWMAGRFVPYIQIILCFLLPLCISGNKKNRKLIIILTIVWCLFLYIYDYIILGSGETYPYKTFFMY